MSIHGSFDLRFVTAVYGTVCRNIYRYFLAVKRDRRGMNRILILDFSAKLFLKCSEFYVAVSNVLKF